MTDTAWDSVNKERGYLLRLAETIEHGGDVGPHWVPFLQKLYWNLDAVAEEREALDKGVLVAAHQVVAVWTARQEGRSSAGAMRSVVSTLVHAWRQHERVYPDSE